MNAWILCHASDLAPYHPWEVAAVVERLLQSGEAVAHLDGDVELARPGKQRTRHAQALAVTEGVTDVLFDLLPTTPKTAKTKTAVAALLGVVRHFTQLDGDEHEDKEKPRKR